MQQEQNDQTILTVITARANSKRLVGKNYTIFDGLPLFLHSVKHAMDCGYNTTICISSDCSFVKYYTEEFLNNMEEDSFWLNKIHFLQRPEEFATDTSKNEDALIHALDYFSKNFKYDWVVNLQPTSPRRPNNLLGNCIRKMISLNKENNNFDSLVTVSKHTPFFYHIKENELVAFNHDPCNRPMSQQFTEKDFLYHDNGNVYITRSDVLKEKRCRVGYCPTYFVVDDFSSLQIDSIEDFKVLEKIGEVV